MPLQQMENDICAPSCNVIIPVLVTRAKRFPPKRYPCLTLGACWSAGSSRSSGYTRAAAASVQSSKHRLALSYGAVARPPPSDLRKTQPDKEVSNFRLCGNKLDEAFSDRAWV